MDFTLQQIIRNLRNKKLQDSDWTQLTDSPLDNTKKSQWVTYRQTLRDLPSSQNINSIVDLSTVTWPIKPA